MVYSSPAGFGSYFGNNMRVCVTALFNAIKALHCYLYVVCLSANDELTVHADARENCRSFSGCVAINGFYHTIVIKGALVSLMYHS